MNSTIVLIKFWYNDVNLINIIEIIGLMLTLYNIFYIIAYKRVCDLFLCDFTHFLQKKYTKEFQYNNK